MLAPSGHICSFGPSLPRSAHRQCDKYIAKVLNTDPYMLDSKYHYLYADFPVDDVVGSVTGQKVAILRGDDTNVDKFGNFKSRYTAAQTTSFISQPFVQICHCTYRTLNNIRQISTIICHAPNIYIRIANIDFLTKSAFEPGVFF